MKLPFRITDATLDVMEALVQADGHVHGYVIASRAGRPTGTVYPVLSRLEAAGLVSGAWEAKEPVAGRPIRRLYVVTSKGHAEISAILQERRVPSQHATPAFPASA